MSNIKVKNVVQYTVMPGIIPRCRRLFTSGFGYLAFLMAHIYAMVRLLPERHPYLLEENIGRFGVRAVIAEAANNLVWDKRNIDQIAIFMLLLLSMVMLAVQLAMLLASFFIGSSFAQSIFITANPDHDIAFMLLDRVFGIPGFFGSCVATGAACMDSAGNQVQPGPFPWPFHIALHQFFRYYSVAILVVGTIIFLYYVVVVVAETAMTGSPFGQRFQNVWVPIRLVVAIGLLIPLPLAGGGGTLAYSAGQYIAFAAAKYGSSLATNSWLRFNAIVENGMGAGLANPIGESQTLIGKPKAPDLSGMVEAMSFAHTCAFMFFHLDDTLMQYKDKQSGNGYPTGGGATTQYLNNNTVKPYFLKSTRDWMGGADAVMEVTANTSYQEALEFFFRGDIIFTFGRIKPEKQGQGVGTLTANDVQPVCGEVRVSVLDARDAGGGAGQYSAPGTGNYSGAVAVQQFYFNLVRNHWFEPGQNNPYLQFGGRVVLGRMIDGNPCNMNGAGVPGVPACVGGRVEQNSVEWRQFMIGDVGTNVDLRLLQIWTEYNQNMQDGAMDPAVLLRGWGGAGIWYNKLAQLNGNWTASVVNPPVLQSFPMVMEELKRLRAGDSKALTGLEVFNPSPEGEDVPKFKEAMEGVVNDPQHWATIMYDLAQYWRGDASKSFNVTGRTVTMGAMEAAMHAIFGTNGLFSMVGDNIQVHPLAQLATLGRGLVEASIRNIAISTGSSALGGMLSAMGNQAGGLASAAGDFFSKVSFISLSAGLVLFYVVPFLPFLYFYFAVASWIKTIFEAMVGVPLWALAHLRLDGDGLPGDSAQNGYFLILEIFVRPILTVFGLLAAMIIFSAQVRILNLIWTLVTENLGGFNADGTSPLPNLGDAQFQRSVVDEFFFTVTYAIVVYMMATAAFKLIDTIPDQIMRWAGSGVSSFGDINHDPTGDLTRYAALGGLTVGREAAQGVSTLGRGLGGSFGSLARGIGGRGG